MMPFRPRTRLALTGLALILVAGTAGVLATGRAADEKKSTAPRPALTVTTARPESARLPLQRG